MTTPFDFLNAINQTKENIIRDGVAEEKEYKPFIINRLLSYHATAIFDANEMNRLAHLDPMMQFEYLINSLPKAKRFAKWIKPPEDGSLEAVMEYFGYSRKKAQAAMKLISEDDLIMIKQKTNKGGVDEQRNSRKPGRSKTKKA